MKNMLFIVNPKSGREQIRARFLDVLDLFSAAGYAVQVHVTQRQRDAAGAAARWGADRDLIVCSGGDGTLNEVISGMMELSHAPMLGYIPSGSTNDYASSLEIPRGILEAARNVIDGTPYRIDVGRFCGDRYFVYIAAFGAFTEISYQTPQDKKNLLGHQAYVLEGVKGLGALKAHRMKVEWGDHVLEEEFIFGMVTNTISVGGFKGLVTQSVSLNDGEFEVLLIRNPRTARDLSNIISYMFLKEEPNDFVFKFRTDRIRFTSEKPVDWVLDGEFGGSRRIAEAENLRERIRILHSAEKPKTDLDLS